MSRFWGRSSELPPHCHLMVHCELSLRLSCCKYSPHPCLAEHLLDQLVAISPSTPVGIEPLMVLLASSLHIHPRCGHGLVSHYRPGILPFSLSLPMADTITEVSRCHSSQWIAQKITVIHVFSGNASPEKHQQVTLENVLSFMSFYNSTKAILNSLYLC